MVTRGTWRRVSDRSKWAGRRDAARDFLKAAKTLRDIADRGDDARLVVQGAILSVIAYGDALTIKVAGIKNTEDHQQLAATLRHALGNRLPATEATRIKRLLSEKDDTAYGHRRVSMAEARSAIDKAESFANWAEQELNANA